MARKVPFTHLVAIPFTNEVFQQNYLKFRKSVLERFGFYHKIEETLFQNHQKLHLTICTLTLKDEKEISEAKSIMENQCRELINSVLTDGPLRLKIQGIDLMNKDPKKASILFACIENAERVQNLCDQIANIYGETEFTEKQNRVKLHITLMNSIYRFRKDRKRPGESKTSDVKNKVRNEPFDASRILESYKDMFFGEVTAPAIQLAAVRETDPNGYYNVIHEVRMVE